MDLHEKTEFPFSAWNRSWSTVKITTRKRTKVCWKLKNISIKSTQRVCIFHEIHKTLDPEKSIFYDIQINSNFYVWNPKFTEMSCKSFYSMKSEQRLFSSDLENLVFEWKFCVTIKQIIKETIEIANKMDTNSWIAKNKIHLV